MPLFEWRCSHDPQLSRTPAVTLQSGKVVARHRCDESDLSLISLTCRCLSDALKGRDCGGHVLSIAGDREGESSSR